MNKEILDKELSTLTPKRNSSTIIIFVVTILLFVGFGCYLQFGTPPISESEFFGKPNIGFLIQTNLQPQEKDSSSDWYREFEKYEHHNCYDDFIYQYLFARPLKGAKLYEYAPTDLYTPFPHEDYIKDLKRLMVGTGFYNTLDSCLVESHSLLGFVEEVDKFKKHLSKKNYTIDNFTKKQLSPYELSIEAFSLYRITPAIDRDSDLYNEMCKNLKSLYITLETFETIDITSIAFTISINKNGNVSAVEFSSRIPKEFNKQVAHTVYRTLRKQIMKWKLSPADVMHTFHCNVTFTRNF